MKGKGVTGDPEAAEPIRQKERQCTAEAVEVSDKTVTGREARYAETFGQTLLRVLEK